MKTWIIEEYLSLPIVLCNMYSENTKKPTGILQEKIQFGKDKYQYLLYFRPIKAAAKNNTILFLHGGGWAAGSPEGFAFVGRFFSGLGFNVILCGYRHAPKYKHPAQIEDVYSGLAAGIRVMKEHRAFTGKIIVAGQSAGAHLGALLVLDEENALKHRVDPSIFSAMILISGPVDFSVCNAKQINIGLHSFLESEGDFVKADPISLVKVSSKTPVLCMHGGRDPIVDVKNSINFYNKMEDNTGETSRLVIAKDKHHADLLRLFIKNTEETRVLVDYLYKIEKYVIS